MFHDPVQRNALQREVERLYDQYGTAMVEDIVKGRHLPRKRVKEGRGCGATIKMRE